MTNSRRARSKAERSFLESVKITLAQIAQDIHTIKVSVDELQSSQDLNRWGGVDYDWTDPGPAVT